MISWFNKSNKWLKVSYLISNSLSQKLNSSLFNIFKLSSKSIEEITYPKPLDNNSTNDALFFNRFKNDWINDTLRDAGIFVYVDWNVWMNFTLGIFTYDTTYFYNFYLSSYYGSSSAAEPIIWISFYMT